MTVVNIVIADTLLRKIVLFTQKTGCCLSLITKKLKINYFFLNLKFETKSFR